jgi:CubicO group peptidase (beta-lactamase class C family)
VSPDAAALSEILEEGLAAGLYSGAAAAVLTPEGRTNAFAGTHAYGDEHAVGPGSLFDLASVSKTFTAAVLLRLAETGRVGLDDPVAPLLPIADDSITLRMLLTHTSGLPAESFLWRDSPGLAPGERIDAVLSTPLVAAADSTYLYSCLGYIASGVYAERVTGTSLAGLLDELVCRPLGLASVGFGPVDRESAVATEEEPWVGRGLVRGEVHDETNWYLGGRVGNAGLFGSVDDVLTFAASFLDDRLLGPEALPLATTDQLEPRHGAAYGQGLGPRIRDRELFGEVDAFGHAGFTGTMWLAIPARAVAAVLLTNRVHPHRDRADIDPFRRRFSAWAATRGHSLPRCCG